MKENSRIEILDALRGFCILLVIAYHLGYNLVAGGYLPEKTLYNPLLAVLRPLFAGIFVVLAGVSSRFSKNNFKRGGLLLLCAGAVSLAAYINNTPIWFGILHLLAACVFLYAFLEKLRITLPAVLIGAFFLARFGITVWPVLKSYDYFPIVPWGFVFFAGVILGGPIKDGLFPKWFYGLKVPVLPAVGRRTLVIYLAHQPVLYGLMLLFETAAG